MVTAEIGWPVIGAPDHDKNQPPIGLDGYRTSAKRGQPSPTRSTLSSARPRRLRQRPHHASAFGLRTQNGWVQCSRGEVRRSWPMLVRSGWLHAWRLGDLCRGLVRGLK